MSIGRYNYVVPVIDLLSALEELGKAPASKRAKEWTDWCAKLQNCGYPGIAEALVNGEVIQKAQLDGRDGQAETEGSPSEEVLEAIRETLGLAIDISHWYFHAEPHIQQCIRPALEISNALKYRTEAGLAKEDAHSL